jgi:hypothetical protein
MKTEYCDNQFCENEAVKTVFVSVSNAADSKRNFCAACYEVFTIGVQHGRISENQVAYLKDLSTR